MIKKRLTATLLAAVLLAALLAGCGQVDSSALLSEADGKLASGDAAGAAAIYEKASSYDDSGLALRGLVNCYLQLDGGQNTEKLLDSYLRLCDSSAAVAADFAAAGELLIKSGDAAAGRNSLEKAYRLSLDPAYLTRLSTLAVDAEKDDPAVLESLSSLLGLISSGETDKAAELISSSDWAAATMPRLDSGSRRYYLNNDSGLLRVLVGMSDSGRHTSAWLIKDGKAVYIRYDDRGVVLATVGVDNNSYNGAFSFESCDAATGSYLRGSGQLADGLPTGLYSFNAQIGSGKADPMALWQGRSQLAVSEYSGSFTTPGRPDAAQLSYEPNLIFAYSADAKHYLTLAAAANGSVTPESFGVIALSQWPSAE